jgi:phospholipid transport system substrate-binding protein
MKLLAALILCIFSFNSYAYQNGEKGVKDFVNVTSTKVMSLVKSDIRDEEKKAKLTEIFVETMDMDWIGKFVLGQYWRTMSDADKIDYLATYRKFLITAYVPLFKKYNNQILLIKDVKQISNEQYMVITEIDSANKQTKYKVEYRLRYVGGKFKVIDIIGEGVSLLATQRSEFSSIINNGGYKALKKQLEEKAVSTVGVDK